MVMSTIRDLSKALRPKYPWLKFLAEAPDLDETLREELKGITPTDARAYNHRQFDSLLRDVSGLLDRCLAYRREYQELSGEALRQAMDYKFFDDQRQVSEELELAPWIGDLKTVDVTARSLAIAKFDSVAGREPLALGFSALAKAEQAVSEHTVASEATRRTLVARRWGVLARHQDSLKHLHEIEGHPLNFGDRAGRVLGFLKEDFREATLKTLAAQRGINKIFGYDSGYIWANDKHPLDRLVVLTRKLIRAVDRCSQFEFNFVSYQEVHYKGLRDYSLGQMQVNYSVANRLKANADHAFRLQGVAARIRCNTIRSDSSNQADAAFIVNRQMITADISMQSPGQEVFITLPHVGVIGPEPQDFYRGPAIQGFCPWNNDPVLDAKSWFVFVSDLFHPDASIQPGSLDEAVASIVVYFDVVATPVGFFLD